MTQDELDESEYFNLWWFLNSDDDDMITIEEYINAQIAIQSFTQITSYDSTTESVSLSDFVTWIESETNMTADSSVQSMVDSNDDQFVSETEYAVAAGWLNQWSLSASGDNNMYYPVAW